MLRKIVCLISAVIILILAVGCGSEPHKPKLGVSFGVGGATRWVGKIPTVTRFAIR